MECVRSTDQHMLILADDGRTLAQLVMVAADPGEFDELTDRLAELLQAGPAPRITVRYREGLLEDVRADIACEVVVIEEDRFDDPPICTKLRPVSRGDMAAVNATLKQAGHPAG